MEQFESAFDMYRQMAANIPDCSIYIFDHDFDYLLAEGEEVTKLGMESESLIGANFFEVWPQEVTMQLSPYYLDTLKGKRQKLEQQTENGYFIQHFIPVFDANSEVIAGMVVSQNITLLNAVQQKLDSKDQELEAKERLLETVINTVGEGIIAVNDKEEVVLSNPAADKLFGFSLKEKTIGEVREAIDAKITADSSSLSGTQLPIGMALEGAVVDSYTLRLQNRVTHRLVLTESSARPLKDSEGQLKGAVLVMRDVSARKELEALLEENLAALKQKNSRLEQFMTKLSHNLMGPAANLNILFSLLSKAEAGPEKEAIINKIGEVVQVLHRSTGNLREVMESYTSSNEKWGLNNFAHPIISFCAAHSVDLKNKDISIKYNFEAIKEVLYPINQFEGLMKGLLNNLLHHSEEHSKVRISSFASGKSVGMKIKMKGFKLPENLTENRAATHPDEWLPVRRQIESLGGTINIERKKIYIVF